MYNAQFIALQNKKYPRYLNTLMVSQKNNAVLKPSRDVSLQIFILLLTSNMSSFMAHDRRIDTANIKAEQTILTFRLLTVLRSDN